MKVKDKYLKELLKDINNDIPAKGFTDRVMHQINYTKLPVMQKVSLIKKYKFIVIFVLTFTVISLLVFLFPESQSSFLNENLELNKLDYSFLDKIRHFFSVNININFSFSYIFILLAFVLLVFIDNIIPKFNRKYIEKHHID